MSEEKAIPAEIRERDMLKKQVLAAKYQELAAKDRCERQSGEISLLLKAKEELKAERDREGDEWRRLVDRLRQENRLLTHRHDDIARERDRLKLELERVQKVALIYNEGRKRWMRGALQVAKERDLAIELARELGEYARDLSTSWEWERNTTTKNNLEMKALDAALAKHAELDGE
jgi:hypothetical protein